MTESTDRIEKTIDLRAPLSRVWKAISDSKEFGTWFQMAVDGPFEAGRTVGMTITTPGAYQGRRFEIRIERVEPETYLSYRWHPAAIEPNVDYSNEPTTLVEFRLESTPSGTRLHLVESGFDRIPAARRANAFRMNDGGWAEQVKNIESYVAQHP